MECIYGALLRPGATRGAWELLTNIHTFMHTFIHTFINIHTHVHSHIHSHIQSPCQPCKVMARSSGAVIVRYLAQGHLSKLGGAGDLTSNPRVVRQPALLSK